MLFTCCCAAVKVAGVNNIGKSNHAPRNKPKKPKKTLDMIDKIKALLMRKSSCLLATTDGNTPHCSLMAYIASEAADRLHFGYADEYQEIP
jgi:hypothetical protein